MIRKMKVEEIKECFDLVEEVFLEFEAPEYSQEGIDEFINGMLHNEQFIERYKNGSCTVYVAIEDEKIVGMISMRSSHTHINLLFVKKEYHHQGIATALWNTMKDDLIQNEKITHFTVNSSPYGHPFYLKVGFIDQDSMQEHLGIKYYPMAMDV